MVQLRLSRETGNGWYFTLPGVGIIVTIINDSLQEAGVDPNDVVLNFHHGNRGNYIDVMYPTPHTYLFNGFQLEDGEISFRIGKDQWSDDAVREFPLANPDLAKEIAKCVLERAKTHKATRKKLNSA